MGHRGRHLCGSSEFTKDRATSTVFDLHSDGRRADLTGVEGPVWRV